MIKLKRKRKNPKLKHELQEILNRFYPNSDDIEVKYISKGVHGHAYKLILYTRKVYNNVILQPDTYVLKLYLEPEDTDSRFDRELLKPLTLNRINYAILLSKYGLIPEIYVIEKYLIIMKFIKGKSLGELVDEMSIDRFQIIMNKCYKLAEKWKKLGFAHGDLHRNNILVTDSNKVFFIDPSFDLKLNFDLEDLKEIDDQISKVIK